MEMVTTIGISPATTQFTERRISERGFRAGLFLPRDTFHNVVRHCSLSPVSQWEHLRGAALTGDGPVGSHRRQAVRTGALPRSTLDQFKKWFST